MGDVDDASLLRILFRRPFDNESTEAVAIDEATIDVSLSLPGIGGGVDEGKFFSDVVARGRTGGDFYKGGYHGWRLVRLFWRDGLTLPTGERVFCGEGEGSGHSKEGWNEWREGRRKARAGSCTPAALADKYGGIDRS